MQTQNGISRGKAIYKVPGGKLIKVDLGVRDGRIAEIRITGDFFMHPEDAIEELERMLMGTPTQIHELEEVINNFLMGDVEVIGLQSQDFIDVLKMAIKGINE